MRSGKTVAIIGSDAFADLDCVRDWASGMLPGVTIACGTTRCVDRIAAEMARASPGIDLIEVDDDGVLLDICDKLLIFHLAGDDLAPLVIQANQKGVQVYELLADPVKVPSSRTGRAS